MAVANFKNIPVFSWMPRGSHYYPAELDMLGQKLHNWRHPFFFNTSIKLVETLEDAVVEIAEYKLNPPVPLLQSDFILEPIQHYINTNLKRDEEMRILIKEHQKLSDTVNMIVDLKA